ncbi:50S ribosomal protein L5 [Elusimicrobiota bacterium]
MIHKKITNSLYKKYAKQIVPELTKTFKVENMYELPQIKKIIVNMGLRKAKDDKSVLEEAVKDMATITGQKPVITKARKSISNFGVRQGMPIGCKVTLRGKLMYDFLEKLLRIVIPRIRDFRGLNRSFDRNGNLTIGLKDETIFPEINADNIKSIKGLGISIVTDSRNRDKSEKMMELMGFPFIK